MIPSLEKSEFRGVIPPLVSTFDDREDIDLERFSCELHYMRDVGIKVAVVGGSTGEGDTLKPEEVASLVESAASQKLRAIAGIITTTTRDAIHRGVLARDAGACAIMLAPPIYFMASDEALDNYLRDVASGTGLPIVFYNAFASKPALLRRLAAIPGVIAIKEPSVESVAELVQTIGARVPIAIGSDTANLAGLALGAHAVVSGINTVIPKECLEIYLACERGDYVTARKILDRTAQLHRLLAVLMNFPSRVKYAVNLQGRDVGNARRPNAPLSHEDQVAIRNELEKIGLLRLPIA